jgi:hypothetical protein
MKYFDGADVRVGDIVSTKQNHGEELGTVIQIVAPGSPEAHHWNFPSGGVLIESHSYGLSLTEDLANDPEVELVRRNENGFGRS